ncbi:glycosyltransferase, MGT family [Crinalium epipsammum PCC 9333]|uniref:Glycosyltransferase, MGT family n=1 Tax=Crinalium epipsammum PCC 9333 TaxID=1173022 RepID=K9W4T5_9CYAN|nr:glycosyltransferase [Crinalium epipsammum]AFZ15368.1 glycosyltransferase, MGT family [Crinalium epipsammum PCC 9333]
MTHFGIICPPYSGHINPLAALGRELRSRGHKITFLQIPDVESKVRSEGLDFYPLGMSIYKRGELAKTLQQLTQLSGIEALNYSVNFCKLITEIICKDAPNAIKFLGIEALLVDQLEPVGETVAEFLKIPFICVSSGQVIHRRVDVPPFFTGWSYKKTWWARLGNQAFYYILDRSCESILQVINQYRRKWNLSDYPEIYASYSKLAHISQQPAAFDFPCPNLPAHFHYIAPFRNASPRAVSFPFERLTGQPLIYASLGSIQNTKDDIFHKIAAACADLDVQLVITHGGGMSAEAVQKLPGSPLVVEYAPQLEVLSKASLTITHGGLNTVLDSLSYGVPLVAIPITFEQPGTGARIRWTKTGEVIPLKKLTIPRLRRAIKKVLTEESYSKNALKIKNAIAQSGGVKRAADIVEQAINSNPATSLPLRAYPKSTFKSI